MDGIVSALQGRLGQDGELKYLDNGTPLLRLSVGVLDTKAAEKGEPLQWVRVALFGEKAEQLEQACAPSRWP
jgi:single-stranded DNA-binding protein